MLAILAAFWGLTTWGAWRLARATGGTDDRTRALRVLAYLPPAWVLVEWARTQGYFAFPWGALGYAWLDSPAGQLAEYVGVYGLSLLVLVPAALLALPWAWGPRPSARRLPATVLAAALVAGALVGGARLGGGLPLDDPTQARRVLLVQGDVDPFARATSPANDLNVHLRLTNEGVLAAEAAGEPPFDLVVWPEGAVLGYDLTAPDAGPLREAITSAAPGAAFIVGGRVYERGRSYNSLVALEAASVVGRYDKHYLVPFGERWPLYEQLQGLYAMVFRAFGLPLLVSTSAGELIAPTPADGLELGAYVCYESVFPQVQRALVARGADVLVLATNDAWFGVGAGARQHFDMGRMRAVETRRWLLRAGNDGVTAVVDASGRVVAEAPRGVPTTLAATFYPRTSITAWVRFGGYAPLVLLGALLLLAAAFRARGRAANAGPSRIRVRR